MKRLILNSFLFAALSFFAVSCQKEKVAPFNGGSSSINNLELRGAEDTNGDGIIDEQDGTEITDGGNSSDYDSKGAKNKKN
jgi:hypothetical protein